jgi:hypothetical protein
MPSKKPRRASKREQPNKILGADYHLITLEPYLIGMLVLETDEGERKFAINRRCAELLIERMEAFLRELPDPPD